MNIVKKNWMVKKQGKNLKKGRRARVALDTKRQELACLALI